MLQGAGPDRLFFEAPRKDQQAWLIRELGPDVNLANVALDDVARRGDTAARAACRHRRAVVPAGPGVTDPAPPPRRNVVPGAYRGVAVTEVDVPLEDGALAAWFTGREAYRRTRFIVVRNGGATAVLAVQKASDEPLFSTDHRCPDPGRAGRLRLPAVPRGRHRGALRAARARRGRTPAASAASWSREGTATSASSSTRRPLRLTVREVVPPHPPKLLDQVRRLLDVTEDLPPIELARSVVELGTLARTRPAGSYLLPCRGGGVAVGGASTTYLDERPERRDWTLDRLRAVATDPRVVLRRARRSRSTSARAGGAAAPAPLLTKCCLLETGHRGRRRPGRRAVGSIPRPDLRGADGARPRRGSRRGHPSERLPAVRPPVGHAGDRAAVRGTSPAAELAGHPRRAGRGPGPTGHHPARGGRADRRARPRRVRWTSTSSPEQTRLTSHSMLGLIRALQQVLPEPAREHVYFGATVQDVTDTWFALVMRDVGALVWRDLRAVEETLLALAVAHRDTVMVGRTHGQPGSPITFGFKVASWADEVRRHLERLREGRSRWLVGQLGGAVGRPRASSTRDGMALRAEFCAELGLADPGISWLTSRDRIAEFGAPAGDGLRHPGPHRQRGLRAPATGDRRAAGADQPRTRSAASPCRTSATPRAASTWTPWPGWCGPTPACCRGHGRRARARRARLEGRVGGAARGLPADRRRAAAGPAPARRGWSSTSTRCGPTCNRHGDQLASERILAGLSQRLGKHAAQQLHARRPRAGHARRRAGRGRPSCAPGAANPSAAARGVARPAGGRRRRDGRCRRGPGARRPRRRARVLAVSRPRVELADPADAAGAGAAAGARPSTPDRCSSSATT